MKRRTMQRLQIVADALEEYSRNEKHSALDRANAALVLDDLAAALNVFHVEPDYFGADQKGGRAWQG